MVGNSEGVTPTPLFFLVGNGEGVFNQRLRGAEGESSPQSPPAGAFLPKKMLSQESQKMCFECSVARKCEILKSFKIQTFKIYKSKLKFKLLNVLTHQNST